MNKIVIPVPPTDFDPTEAAVTWKMLTQNGIQVVFSTPSAQVAIGDQRMVTGDGLGVWSALLRADQNGRRAYDEMIISDEFKHPIRWDDIRVQDFDGIVLPGGHAPGMKVYLESEVLQNRICEFFSANKLVGAICHGTVLVARSKDAAGTSMLDGRQSTALLRAQEMTAWAITCPWLKNYYRTYPESVQAEVSRSLGKNGRFISGPMPFTRDSPQKMENGFVVIDRNYISARWPGDAHLFGRTLVKSLTGP